MTPEPTARRLARADSEPVTGVWTVVLILTGTVAIFALSRAASDLPMALAGELPEAGSFDERYVRFVVPAYLHIAPGVVYLVGACFQLARRFRARHPALHRRMGRVVLGAGLVSGVFALVFGAPHSYGGYWQSVATVVFSCYFLLALGLALRSILRRDIANHRRWMIRAFAIGLAVGTIRIWIGLLSGFGILEQRPSFAVAFCVAFVMHAIAAELWLHWRPDPPRHRRPLT